MSNSGRNNNNNNNNNNKHSDALTAATAAKMTVTLNPISAPCNAEDLTQMSKTKPQPKA